MIDWNKKGVYTKCYIKSKIDWKIVKQIFSYLFSSLADGLHDDCSSSGVDVSFHENQGLPSAKNRLTVYDRQGFVWAQKHRSEMGVGV